ncbi:hypothetical protein [Sulfitobacter sp. S190]|uniref:hypothetical protein n=1 Tax=Sulfitobacter sp. S190 TaxID=2867022 RepID=UPI0021A65986|nr:hypothetical protein [Sulfitobacter sp. S190]UWR23581.1 hypothetical protein K3756_06295 [Sulfitobacter sp. S190]
MKIITKYFNAETQWKNYDSGSFRFGTLRGYASGEDGDGERFSDDSEGTITTHYGKAGDEIKHLEIGGLSIGNLRSIPPAPEGTPLYELWKEMAVPIAYNQKFDANIFCASLGPYSVAHHRIMRYGSNELKVPYKGNEELTGWAEINVAKFVRATRAWVMKNSAYPEIRNGSAPFLLERPVSYNKRVERRPINDAHAAGDFSEDTINRLVFQKPERFQPEREFRITVSSHPLQHTSKTVPMFPKSFALKRSIIRMGRVKP